MPGWERVLLIPIENLRAQLRQNHQFSFHQDGKSTENLYYRPPTLDQIYFRVPNPSSFAEFDQQAPL